MSRFLSVLPCALLTLVLTMENVGSAQTDETSGATAVTSPSDSEPAMDNSAGATTATATSPGATPLIANLTIFVLAIFVGFELITRVPPTLHTPLMSGSNAISGITLVGALLATGAGNSYFAAFLGFVAVVLATVNVVGGFLVTDRMLSMFRRGKA